MNVVLRRQMSVVKSCALVSKDTIVKHYFRKEWSEVVKMQRTAINAGKIRAGHAQTNRRQANIGKTSPPRLVRPPLRSLTAAAWTGPEVLVPDGVVLVPPVSPVPVPVPVVVAPDPVAEGPEVGDCPELAEVSEELNPDEVAAPDVWVPEAEADSGAEDELEPEELPDPVEMMLVD